MQTWSVSCLKYAPHPLDRVNDLPLGLTHGKSTKHRPVWGKFELPQQTWFNRLHAAPGQEMCSAEWSGRGKLPRDSGPLKDMTSPTAADVIAAAARIGPHVVRTPLVRASELDAHVGGPVVVKLEPLQRTGSFKIRGAMNRILVLGAAERRAGVVAWSSGNHAQGVAAAAGQFGVPAVIVMPADAPAMKIANTRALGAEVVLYDRAREDREAIARAIAAQRGLVVVPSYDDAHIIAGQGTLGLELMEQAHAMGAAVGDILIPASGGGLAAGVGLAVRHRDASVQLFTAEPAGYDDHRASLAAGRRVRNASTANALCDALLAPTPGELTWPINAALLSGGYAVCDAEVCAAMAWAFRHLKVVVEPGGAVALAAILAGRHRAEGRTTAVVLSGGNVDAATFAACLTRSSGG
jgi:threonine dehydratase